MSFFDLPLWKRCALIVCSAVLVAPLVYAQSESGNLRTEADRRMVHTQYSLPYQLHLTCELSWPGQVRRFRVTCSDTSKIDVKVADCCIPGDHWQVTVRQWDSRPNTAVTTAPGGAGSFGVPGRVYTYNSSTNVDALIECSYPHGINVFPAEADILLEFSGMCYAEDVDSSSEFSRAR
ncbi:hypothetical protein [Hyalangium minutum]|uniref:Lipoprotein n=1 Tax=Hyalangium minutum TaxID=394096 RepID=A0A085W9A9_9BACT|nr:hypothetical protein [Hyalangium minutum]KFE64272.1 hypothetical protein DB31_2066 [Hyalangium minutum]